MKEIEFKLDEAEYEHIKKIELSINKFSKEYTTANLMARNMLNTIGSLYDARQQIIQKKVEESKVDPQKIVDMTIDNGILKIVTNEE